jgi:DNA-binding NarL/FixJ family response regulator
MSFSFPTKHTTRQIRAFTVRAMNPSNRRIRTLIADDSRTVLLSVCRYLEFERDFEVIATATDGLQLLHKTERYRPDLVLTDLSMPRISELEAPMALSKRATCLKNLWMRSAGVVSRVRCIELSRAHGSDGVTEYVNAQGRSAR